MIEDTNPSEVRPVLAGNLRRLRVAHRLSLSELARMTAMSKATLSGIEHGQANPTIDTLAALAGALRVPIGELLTEPKLTQMRIVRAAEAEPFDGYGVRRRPLQQAAVDGHMDLFELALGPGQAHNGRAGREGSRKGVLVLQGKLVAGPLELISELSEGDWAFFAGDVEYVFQAGPDIARAVVLSHTPGSSSGHS